MSTPPPIDLWSPLTHKAPLNPDKAGKVFTAPTWVPAHDARRLAAYKVLSSYLHNVARYMISSATVGAKEAAENRREYGDAGLLVDRIIAGIFGENPSIVVDGADFDPADGPEFGRKPAEPQSADGPERAAYEAQLRVWEASAERAVETWETAAEAAPGRQERQEWLRKWATDEGLVGKLLEAERDGVGLGDAVIALSWSTTKKRAKVEVYDPGFYFPVLDTMGRVEDYPTRVHFAWEFERPTGDGRTQTWVRRVTYELAPIMPTTAADEGGYLPPVNARQAGFGWVRDYPWNEEPSEMTCYLTDAAYPLRDLTGKAVHDFPEESAEYATNEDGVPLRMLDLGVDFLPVIHWPNTPASKEHFGASSLMLVAQILDDISSADTDTQGAQALAAGPAIALSGTTNAGALSVAPGVVFNLGPDGRMDVLDLTQGLEALMLATEKLLDRLSVNGRVPAEMLGRVKASEVPSGVALSLAFGPFGQLVEMLRLVRGPKHRLLLKFVQRFALVNGEIEGEIMDASLAPGSYLASDLAGVVGLVVNLVNARATSKRTGLRMLADAGVAIDDIGEELAAIEREDTEGAVRVADATGREDLAAERLGYVIEQAPAAPATAPAAPTQPTTQPPTVTLPPQ